MSKLEIEKPGVLRIIIDDLGDPYLHADGFWLMSQQGYTLQYTPENNIPLNEGDVHQLILKYAIDKLQQLMVKL